MSGPLCKVCGKPVPKHTIWKSWGRIGDQDERPRSKEEAARRSNHPMVSCKWGFSPDERGPYIVSATYWDGTWEWDGHFHAQSCAAAYGRWAAGTDQLKGWAMQPYHDAMKARTAKEKA